MKIKRLEKMALKRHAPILRTLSRSRKTKRNAIINGAPSSLFKAIKILHRLLVKGGINLNNAERNKIPTKARALIRKIHGSKDPKKTILQNGEGFSSVLRIILPIVGSMLGIAV